MKLNRIGIHFLWILASALSGCGGDESRAGPSIPSYCKPGEPYAEVGTGQYEFIELTENSIVPIVSGPQGGSHVWISLRTRAIGSNAMIEYGVNDNNTGELLSWEGLRYVAALNKGENGGEVYGLTSFFNEKDPAKNTGKKVKLWAILEGDCHPPQKAESPPVQLQ